MKYLGYAICYKSGKLNIRSLINDKISRNQANRNPDAHFLKMKQLTDKACYALLQAGKISYAQSSQLQSCLLNAMENFSLKGLLPTYEFTLSVCQDLGDAHLLNNELEEFAKYLGYSISYERRELNIRPLGKIDLSSLHPLRS